MLDADADEQLDLVDVGTADVLELRDDRGVRAFGLLEAPRHQLAQSAEHRDDAERQRQLPAGGVLGGAWVRYAVRPPAVATDLDFGSDCGLAAAGGIVGTYGQDAHGRSARLRVFGPDGSVVRRIELSRAVRVTADSVRNRVAYAAGGTTTEIDTVTGAIVRTTDQAFGARYDGSGDLVVVDENGTPRWLPPA